MSAISTNTSSIDGSVSILHQTPYPCGYFNFGKAEAEDVAYFNCGLVRRPDGLWLITRRSKKMKQFNHGMNDVVAFRLDQTRSPAIWRKININAMFPGQEHFEDPRAFYHEGKTYLSCCNFIIRNRTWTGAHQLMVLVDSQWNTIKRFDPVYGNNGHDLTKQVGNEKNWLWFMHEGVPHLLYLSSPHTVLRCNDQFQPQQNYETTWDSKHIWRFGEIRGGTPPVRVGNEYWSFFHSSTPWGTGSRQYHMGVYAFQAFTPFAITRISREPILSGSFKDPWGPRKPLVVFPCGAVLENSKWFVSLGVNDMASAWIDIPHNEVEKMAEDIHTPPINIPSVFDGVIKKVNRVLNSKRVYYHSGNLGDIIYGLCAIKLAGGGKLLLGPAQCNTSLCRVPVSKDQFDLLKPLLDTQTYLNGVEFRDQYPIKEMTHDLNGFRNKWDDYNLRQKFSINTLCKAHCYQMGVLDKFDEKEPWLDVDSPLNFGRIIVHRSRRYNDPEFPWKTIVEEHGEKLLFIGTEDEHYDFQKMFGTVAFWKVRDFLEMAQLIAGAKFFIGNQSFALSLALAMGQRVLCEEWQSCPDCRFERDTYTSNSVMGLGWLC